MALKNKWYGAKVISNINNNLEKKLEQIGQHIEGQAIREISSGPNQAVKSSRLKNSITHDKPEKTAGHISVRVGTNVKYGVHVEFGTWKMKPRPFLRTALLKSKSRIKEILKATTNVQ